MFQSIQAAAKRVTSNERDQEQQDAPNAPLVFQCAKCRVIVGDSLSLGNADEEAQTITLSSASHVHKTNQVFTPHSGRDVGSSYFPIACASCKTQLGKFYITTLKWLDHLREKYTFNIAALTSYVLGQSEQGFNAAEAVNDAIQGNEDDEEGAREEGLTHRVDELSEEVVKIEHVMLTLTDRVQTVEQQLANSYSADTNGATPSQQHRHHLQNTTFVSTPTLTPLLAVQQTSESRVGSSESKRQRLQS